MKKIYFFIAALFAALTLNAQVGFDYRNGGLGDAIKGGELIENETNITITESSAGKYDIKVTSGSYNETGECSFEIGGITFWYKNSNDGTTAWKPYKTYIQPNGNKRKIVIPVVGGQEVRILRARFATRRSCRGRYRIDHRLGCLGYEQRRLYYPHGSC